MIKLTGKQRFELREMLVRHSAEQRTNALASMTEIRKTGDVDELLNASIRITDKYANLIAQWIEGKEFPNVPHAGDRHE